MSSTDESGLPHWLKNIPPEVVLLGLELLILWMVIPSTGLWILSKKALIIVVLGLSILLASVVYVYAELILWRGVGFITLIGHAKRKNLAHRRKNPNQPSLLDACVSRGVSWARHIRDRTNAVWTKTRRRITPNDE